MATNTVCPNTTAFGTGIMPAQNVPKDYKDAMRLDRINGNNKWQEATDLEFRQVDDCETLLDLGQMTDHNVRVVFSGCANEFL